MKYMIELTRNTANSILERMDHSSVKYCPMMKAQKNRHVGRNNCAWFMSMNMITKVVKKHRMRNTTSSLLRTF